MFPFQGLPSWIHSGKWNLKILGHADHVRAHINLWRNERVLMWYLNPFGIGARLGRDVAGGC